MDTMQDLIMDLTVQNPQTLQHLAGLNMERGPHSVHAGCKEHSYFVFWCVCVCVRVRARVHGDGKYQSLKIFTLLCCVLKF
jgi:hypothetical protein